MNHAGGNENEIDLMVCHTIGCRNMRDGKEISGTLQAKCNGGQSLNYINPVVYACGNGQINTACAALTQQAKALDCMHDQQIVLHEAKKLPRKYVVRRLLPVECARLQGFPDYWGIPNTYSDDDEAFWKEVYETSCTIAGKKHVAKKNMRKWYEGLHTDSAEYRVWGNGIALPCAAYVLRRIAEVITNARH